MPESPAVASAVAPVVGAAPEAPKKLTKNQKLNPKQSDFGGPKKAPTSFFLFGDEIREAVTKEVRAECEQKGEAFKVFLVSAKIGAKWKEVEKSKQEALQAKAVELKKKYDEDLEAWKKTAEFKKYTTAVANAKKMKADKKAVDDAKASGMPSRPLNGQFMFNQSVGKEIQEEMKDYKKEDHNGMSHIQYRAKLNAQKWAALGEEKQNEWKQKGVAAKAKYEEDLKAWKETEAGKAYTKAMEKNAKDKQKNLKKNSSSKRQKGADGKKVEKEEDEEDVDVSDEEEVEESVEDEAEGSEDAEESEE